MILDDLSLTELSIPEVQSLINRERDKNVFVFVVCQFLLFHSKEHWDWMPILYVCLDLITLKAQQVYTDTILNG